MTLIKKFEDILAWQEARKLVGNIYGFSREGAFARDFGLRDQIQRAAVSVMANIAEGFDCESHVEFARFLGYARRSVVEVQSLLYIARDVGYVNEEIFRNEYQRAEKTKALIGGLKKSLKVHA
jgi:four helix bundle protein